jgi:tRNA-dihydrouridine synthase B
MTKSFVEVPQFALAPMAGITDKPFRNLCKRFGASITVSEMVASNPSLRHSKKSQLRTDFSGESGQRIVQIVGHDPRALSEAAKFNEQCGADIIDINMGCPAKKVCKKLAGSALLKDKKLVEEILKSVVDSVRIPVTLKYRTGWCPNSINAVAIAQIAVDCGIQRLALHGRTRACKFTGKVEYQTIRDVVQSVNIPVFANGDITTPQKAKEVLNLTGAAGIMVGRGALGQPWIFQEIHHYIKTGNKLQKPSIASIQKAVLEHLNEIYDFYGDHLGVRIARKHMKWTVQHISNDKEFVGKFNQLTNPLAQIASAQDHFERIINGEVMAA